MTRPDINTRSVAALAFTLVYGIAMFTMIPIITAKLDSIVTEGAFSGPNHLAFFMGKWFKLLVACLCVLTLVKEALVRDTEETLPLNLGFLGVLLGLSGYWAWSIFRI